jgi:hypothetical protein
MPPEQDVEEMDPVSSDGSEQDVSTAATEKVDGGEGATSSSAEGEAPEKDTSSIVRDVVDEVRKAKTAAAPPATGDEAGQAPGDADPKKEPDDENFSDVPFHKHPRFQKLLRQRNEFKVDATRYRNVQTFLDNNGMTGDEAAEGLSILARVKTDPAGALEQAKPFLQRWMIAAGAVLPENLAQRVQKGELTHAAAMEISRANAEATGLRARGEFEQQQRQRREETARQQALVDAATSWEADRRRRDPNFEAKEAQLRKEVAYLIATEGRPTTPEGVKDQLKRAYAAAGPAPAAQAARPAKTPVTGGQVNGSARPEPKSVLDIVRANRAAR